MMFNQSDPTIWGLCLRAATGKQEDPTKLLESLWNGLVQHLIKDVINFFKALGKHIRKRKAKPKQLKIRGRRSVPTNQADFELLAVYALVPTGNNIGSIGTSSVANQANHSLVQPRSTYATWRRRHYPLGLLHEPTTQMVLPLHHDAKKKVATDLFEAEVKLRHRMNHLAAGTKSYISTEFNQVAS